MAETDLDLIPPITIVMTTYFPDERRKVAARMTLKTWAKNLKYRGFLNLHIADDGSPTEYLDHLVLRAEQMQWSSITLTQQNRKGVGASLNAGFRYAFETSPLVFIGMDDWSLVGEFDLTPWARLLMLREDVGVVRLGPPHPNMRGCVEAFTEDLQSWGLRLDRYGFIAGHRPSLYHKRFYDYYGTFKEGCSSLECEDEYNLKVCSHKGPDVIMALPVKFEHIDTCSLSSLQPGG